MNFRKTCGVVGLEIRNSRLIRLRGSLIFFYFLPARRYASAGLCDSDVPVCLFVCLSVRPSVRLSHAGIVPSRAKAGS